MCALLSINAGHCFGLGPNLRGVTEQKFTTVRVFLFSTAREGEIRISEDVAGKRGTPRNVPMCDALRAWLAPYRARLGRIHGMTERALSRRLESFITHIQKVVPGFRWKANALRHSFGSYHVATHRNLELTRTVMGTGMAMLRHHYNDPQFRNDADAYWKLLPATTRGNVVAIG